MTGIFLVFIFALSSLLTFLLVMKKPSFDVRLGERKIRVESYFFGALFGAAVIMLTGTLDLATVIANIRGMENLNLLGVLVLFLSMVFMSIFLDSTGFFEYCAKLALKYSGRNGRKLFFYLYLTVTVLTLFTSNDIIILTLTPFVYYFTKHAGLDPRPFLISEFFAVNTWSMMFHISNPTNMIIVSAFAISFSEYFYWMFLPTVAAGLTNFVVLYFLFRKQVVKRIHYLPTGNPNEAIKDRTGAAMGLAMLSSCLVLLAVPEAVGLSMWSISFIFAAALFALIFLRENVSHSSLLKHSNLRHLMKRMPWTIVPFVVSLFIITDALRIYGVSAQVGSFVNTVAGGSALLLVFCFGAGSTLAANFFNNIPMTVMFVPIIEQVSGAGLLASAYATTIGSNLGANLTPIGALAGILWMRILKHKEFHVSFAEFVKYGAVVTALTLTASLLVLGAEFLIA